MRINVIAFTANGCDTALRLGSVLKDDDVRLFAKTTGDARGIERTDDIRKLTETSFRECDALVFIGATGIAVRYIAPYVVSKDRDPAVVCMDESARFTIPLLSGHIGGGNDLARRIAELMDSVPVITTATDINRRFSVDSFAVKNSLGISDLGIAKEISAAVLRGGRVGFVSDIPCTGSLPADLTPADSGELGVLISEEMRSPFDRTLVLYPKDVRVGVGCRRGTDPEKLSAFVREMLEADGIPAERVGAVCSIDVKKDERAIMDLARELNVPFSYYTADQLNSLEGEFTSSDFVRRTVGVDSVCERSAAMCGGTITRKKTSRDGMTVAFARIRIEPRF